MSFFGGHGVNYAANITSVRTQNPAVIGHCIDDTDNNNVNSVVLLRCVNMSEVVSNMKHVRHR